MSIKLIQKYFSKNVYVLIKDMLSLESDSKSILKKM